MKPVQLPLFILTLFFSCRQPSSPDNGQPTAEDAIRKEEQSAALSAVNTDTSIHYQYKVFAVAPGEKNADNGFGFEITGNAKGAMHIRQETIPAVQGNHPFMSEENAAETAQLMIFKLTHGIIPPAISVEELDSLGVVY